MAELKIFNSNSNEEYVPCHFDKNCIEPIILIGFQKMENLGIGYLASILADSGYRVKVLDFQEKPESILELVISERPLLVGFSLIFQFYVRDFRRLMEYLRSKGVDSHFTIGGHFPTLSYQKTLEMMPDLNSVVRYEGELTLLELVDCLALERDWHNIPGIAYRNGDQIVSNPLRALIHDLDRLPFPYRPHEPKEVLGKKIMPILASRGCARTCSFCSIHVFYRSAPGKVVRIRKPEKVVEEMRMLFEERGIEIFLFQDDDFPLFGIAWHRWAMNFVEQLYIQKLVGKVIWKINCRADVVETALFSSLKEAGLSCVYMGLESGTENGMNILHKEITVDQNLRAVATLKNLGLMWDFGFMLFDPSSTFESIYENINFLRQIVGDGSQAVQFCKMLPYDGTPIKEDLVKSGRFNGDINNPDYDFIDPRLNSFYEALGRAVANWFSGDQGVRKHLFWALEEIEILERLYSVNDGLEQYKYFLKEITKSSNEFLLSMVEGLAFEFENNMEPDSYSSTVENERQKIVAALLKERNQFIYLNQDKLLKALSDHEKVAPI